MLNKNIKSIDELLSTTKRFWDDTSRLSFQERMRKYIAELLPDELALAGDEGRLPDLSQLQSGRCDILVLLVGHSFEPLLQSICAYQPEKIVPVLNKKYGPDLNAAIMWRRLNLLLPLLMKEGLLTKEPILEQNNPLPVDTPSTIFRFLLERQKADWESKSIVIDITGAKKSMVAGAFFFAAYSNTPISYVDFNLYDEERNRPFGSTCNIGIINNPYRDFHLRDWNQARRLYEHYAFSAALKVVNQILAEMKLAEYFTKAEIESVEKLCFALEIYRAWDNGDYRLAHQKLRDQECNLPMEGKPWAVLALGDFWPHAEDENDARTAAKQILTQHLNLKNGANKPEESLFAQPEALRAYIQDELAKVKRLIDPKEDYRAAFLRAAGLDEFLLKSRLALAWLNGDLEIEGQQVSSVMLEDTDWREKYKLLTKESRAANMRSTLLREGILKLKNMSLSIAIRGPELSRYWQDKAFDFDRAKSEYGNPILNDLRNEAIHTHLYLTRDIAEAAVAMASASVDEFMQNWLCHYHPTLLNESGVTSTPKWQDLCQWCQIDFLPFYREEVLHDQMVVSRRGG